jgi:hypothetical protein
MKHFILFILLLSILACRKGTPPPVCRIVKFGSNGMDPKPVTYPRGDSTALFEDGDGFTLYFDKGRRVVRKDEPLLNPYNRKELVYDENGKVKELRYYQRISGGNWQPQAVVQYYYFREKLISIGKPGDPSYYEIKWDGNDVQSVTHWVLGNRDCTVSFSYNGAPLNPNHAFDYFYFVDANTNDVNYKLPYYFGEHLPAGQDDDCGPLSEPIQFEYNFAPNGLIESATAAAGGGTWKVWQYEYECK